MANNVDHARYDNTSLCPLKAMRVKEELVLQSSAVPSTTSLHFVVDRGRTLIFRAPAMEINRDNGMKYSFCSPLLVLKAF